MKHLTIIVTFAIAFAMSITAYADEVPGNHDMPEQESQAEATVSAEEFQFQGVVEYNGRTETWYSSNALYHYRTDEWTPDEDGFYRTDEGYFVVASDAYEQGAVIETSRGLAQVLDSGCGDGVDFYVDWD